MWKEIRKLVEKSNEIIQLINKLDCDNDPLMLNNYLIVENLQIQLLQLISEHQIILNKNITDEIKNGLKSSLSLMINSYENIQNLIAKAYIYKHAKTNIDLLNKTLNT